mgnify:CR=1 FL=1
MQLKIKDIRSSCAAWLRQETAGVSVVILTLVVYLLLVPTHVFGGDNGEFALLSRVQGIAHPPGYPLYLAYLRALNWLPGKSPAQTAGYATAFLASVHFFILYLASRKWGSTAIAAAIAVAFYAGSPLALFYFTQAEVFALNALIVSAIILISAPLLNLNGERRIAGLALLCGMGFAHHHTYVLLLPVIALGTIYGFQGTPRPKRKQALLIGLFCFLLGLSPVLLLFPWSQAKDVYLNSWGYIANWHDFAVHVFRVEYGTFRLSASPDSGTSSLPQHLILLFEALLQAYKFIVPISCIGLLIPLLFSRRENMEWWSRLALLLSFGMAGPLFFSAANIDPGASVTESTLLERFYLLPCLLLVLPTAYGLDRIWQWLVHAIPRLSTQTAPRMGSILPAFGTGLACYSFAFNAGLSYATESVRRSANTENFIRNVLTELPRDTVLLATDDDELYATSYLLTIMEARPDVIVVNPAALGKPWYQYRLAERYPNCDWRPRPLAQWIDVITKRCGRHVAITFPDVLNAHSSAASQPTGIQHGVVRLFPPPTVKSPTAEQLFRLNQRLFSGFRISPVRPSVAHGWASRPFILYEQAWEALAKDMQWSSRSDLSRDAKRLANFYGPCKHGACLSE